jgi:hypothetical protein
MTTPSISKIRAALVVALAVTLGSTALQAQYQTMRKQVYVPFAFEVGLAHFAPGTYVLSDPQEHILSVRGSSGKVFAMDSLEITSSRATESKIVFHKYGDRYFLHEVWTKGKTDHLRCPESKAERQARVQQAATDSSSPTSIDVELAILDNPS